MPEKQGKNSFYLEVLGNPLPKERPRVVNKRAYTPTRTDDYEHTVAQLAGIHWGRNPLMTGRLSVRLYFYRQDKRKCDIDNLCKSILDGLEGVVFKNDNQIDILHAERYIDKTNPRVVLTILEANENEDD